MAKKLIMIWSFGVLKSYHFNFIPFVIVLISFLLSSAYSSNNLSGLFEQSCLPKKYLPASSFCALMPPQNFFTSVFASWIVCSHSVLIRGSYFCSGCLPRRQTLPGRQELFLIYLTEFVFWTKSFSSFLHHGSKKCGSVSPWLHITRASKPGRSHPRSTWWRSTPNPSPFVIVQGLLPESSAEKRLGAVSQAPPNQWRIVFPQLKVSQICSSRRPGLSSFLWFSFSIFFLYVFS